MRIERTCFTCGITFQAIKSTNRFCSRKCFKKDYGLRMKEIAKEEEKNAVFPVYICTFCREEHRLSFNPTNNPRRIMEIVCPHCGISRHTAYLDQDKNNRWVILNESIQIGEARIT